MVQVPTYPNILPPTLLFLSKFWSLKKIRTEKYNQRTIGPVSLTWELRICWIKNNLEIQEHPMFYKLSPIQKHQEQIWPCHKDGHGQPRVIIWKKTRAWASHIVTSVICCKFQKSLFEVWFYTIFFMILYMYIARGRGRQPPGDKILMLTKISCHFIHLLQV